MCCKWRWERKTADGLVCAGIKESKKVYLKSTFAKVQTIYKRTQLKKSLRDYILIKSKLEIWRQQYCIF